MLIFIFFLSSGLLFAENNMDSYIQSFNYRPMAKSQKNKPLYDLGFKLFYDRHISGHKNISCQSCHSLTGYSGDSLPLGIGEGADGIALGRMQKDGVVLPRNTPPLFNLGSDEVKSLFWDGRVARGADGSWITPWPLPKNSLKTFKSLLAVQSIFPLVNPEEMLGKESKLNPTEGWEFVMKQIFEGPFKATYKKMFLEAFPGETEFNIGHVGNALAHLMVIHYPGENTLWDLYLRGNKNILSERMKRGFKVFHEKGKCIECHKGDHFTSWGFQNIGSPQLGADDKGRYAVTKKSEDMYKFRVSPLRNIALTAPYTHSGVFKDLWEIIDHYDDPIQSMRTFRWNVRLANYRVPLKLDEDRVNSDTRERNLAATLPKSLNLTLEEKKDLFCFMAVALTDISLQMDLLKKGITNEVSDCTPRTH